MAVDKAVDSGLLNSRLTELAESIRTKGGTHAFLDFYRGDFKQAVDDLHIGSDLSGVTAQPSDVRSGKRFVTFSGELVSGTKPTQSSREIYFDDGNVIVPAGIYDAQASLATGADPSIIKEGEVVAGVVGSMSAKIHEVHIIAAENDPTSISFQTDHPEWYTTKISPEALGFIALADGVYSGYSDPAIVSVSRLPIRHGTVYTGTVYANIVDGNGSYTDSYSFTVTSNSLGYVTISNNAGYRFMGTYIIVGWGDE